ncbi:MAG: hypothetical protein GF383_12955 [Candidatus Lokiarchaeota archaeon]|nr:hypothetical protein [Candidatus Lokiarchaeota archaeon]MBD3341995.1 hypothetical protein [Candidatus Lokiarchaeota archaeon]
MPTKKNFSKNRTLKLVLLFIIGLNIILPVLFFSSAQANPFLQSRSFNQSDLKTSAFSKDSYDPKNNVKEHSLGLINITDIEFQESGFFNNTAKYTNLDDDLETGALVVDYKETEFIETTRIAQKNDLNENVTENMDITILINESLSVQYNDSAEGYLVYLTRLSPCNYEQVFIENSTIPITELNDNEYSIDVIENKEWLVFDFEEYFQNPPYNFTMHLIYSYNLTVTNWRLNQNTEQDLIWDEEESIVSPKFNYEFRINGNKINQSEGKFLNIPADNLLINLSIFLPDKDYLQNHKLEINSNSISVNFLKDNKIVYTKNLIRANNSEIDIEFTANYDLRFVEPVDESWAIDRLVEEQDIRERIYFPYLVSGPQEIYLSEISIIDESVSSYQIEDTYSQFGRAFEFDEVNVTELDEDIENSLVFQANATKRAGIKITLPYMFSGEICPFTIKYETDQDLFVVITDNINMPISGLEVRIYYYGEDYGTYISEEDSQPHGKIFTDENGEILVSDVPNGNYTIEIYQGDTFIKEAEVSAYNDVNYVVTSIIHFPLVILIFGSVFGIIMFIGIIIYRKNKED